MAGMENKDFEELKEITKQAVEFLRKKGHPHITIIVTSREVKITEDIMGVPLDYDD